VNGQDPKPEIFDVFLCHNSDDKPAVREIAQELIKEGIKPWLDEREIPPGTSWQTAIGEQIESIKSAAVFVGQRNKGRVYTKHKCSSRKRDSFALQNIYFRSHGARNSGGFPRNMVSCFKSRNREASDLPLDASLRKFIAFLSSLPDLPPRADTRTATSPHTR
jgi:hypothetical protein